jgi:hypothetical protein
MPIDTDGWRMPRQRDLAAYAEAAPALGVPALYYAGLMDDPDGELFEAGTWSALARAWAAHREARGLPVPRPTMVRHGP